jgi:hypothetical protein
MKGWTTKFDALATYNAERARGIVHTPEYAEKMTRAQTEFDNVRRDELLAEGWEPSGGKCEVWTRGPAPSAKLRDPLTRSLRRKIK